MRSIAAALGDRYFAEHFRRGAIMRFIMECDDPNVETKYKYGVVLNLDKGDDEVLLAITTSQLEAYEGGRFEDEILRIPVGTYDCFTKETVLSLRAIRPEPTARLKELANSGQLTFYGNVSSDDLSLIEQKLIRSRVIERKYKKRTIPNYRP